MAVQRKAIGWTSKSCDSANAKSDEWNVPISFPSPTKPSGKKATLMRDWRNMFRWSDMALRSDLGCLLSKNTKPRNLKRKPTNGIFRMSRLDNTMQGDNAITINESINPMWWLTMICWLGSIFPSIRILIPKIHTMPLDQGCTIQRVLTLIKCHFENGRIKTRRRPVKTHPMSTQRIIVSIRNTDSQRP